jgi:tRNA-splicing ligase RtcB
VNAIQVDHELFDDPDWAVYAAIGKQEHDKLKSLAREQLGTVGSGNHFVDVFVEEATGQVWIANHFGSRGFGHKTASGFLNLAAGREFLGKAPGEHMDQPPVLLDMNSELGDMYYRAMRLAGRYAYAGRDYVIEQVLGIMGTEADFTVHNHHNYAWKEQHDGRDTIVVRKGATPSAPGQMGFIGGSMGDISVIVRGKDSVENRDSYYSTVHGAGRIMSRTQAAGKMNWKTRTRNGGQITDVQMKEAVRNYGVELRGAGTDESPFVYRKLREVLDAHSETVEVMHVLKPIGVCMAGANEFDPYKD